MQTFYSESIHNMQRWMKSKSHHLCDQTWRWRWLIPDYDSNRWKHSASPEDLSQSSYRCFKMTRWWNTLKHKLAGEIFMQLAFLFVSRALADRWLAEIWRAVNLSDSLLVLLHSLTVTGKHFLPFFGQNLNSKSYCFPTSSNYDLQLPSEFRLCNIIIVSESQTWQTRDSRDEINSFPRLRGWWGSYRGPEFHLELSGLPELMDWVQKRYQGYWKEFQLKTELFTASAEGIFYQSGRIFCQSIECL